DYLYLSPQHKLAKAYLEYGISQKVGFVVLTGEIGAGKTTLIKALIRNYSGNHRLGVLYQTSMGAEDLLELLLQEFEVRGRYSTRAARLAAFNQFLLTAYSRGEHVVLLVDEAQNLGSEALEELRLLSNLQAGKDPLLQVILVGQTGLREKLKHPGLRQLAQRIAVHYHLRPLERLETKEYILFRIHKAGGSGIFTDAALDRLYEYTQGVPRRINAWCDLALVAGFAEGRTEIDADFIDTVVAAQGGTLEEEGEGQDVGESRSAVRDEPVRQAGGNNNLNKEIAELSGRLTRVEGVCLEISNHLIPLVTELLAKIEAKKEVLEAPRSVLPEVLVSEPQEEVDLELDVTPTPLKPTPWWSRLWR
ncbi:MAG: ExeA family protein, partial [Desulfobacca sp.]|uniref:ExeA family protein n=1 Tax=Desulfobacca sp. TaxID=2067990 RepID=UPI00404B43AE